jgi:hypothetical protein
MWSEIKKQKNIYMVMSTSVFLIFIFYSSTLEEINEMNFIVSITFIIVLIFLVRKFLFYEKFSGLYRDYKHAKGSKYLWERLEKEGEKKLNQLELSDAMLYKNHYKEYKKALKDFASKHNIFVDFD